MKKISVMTIFIIVALSMAVTFSVAEEKKQMEKMQAPTMQIKPVDRVALPPKADLRVDAIHSTSCACDLPGVDGFYVQNLMVDVSNGGGSSTTSTLVVTYHDLNLGPQTITKSISSLNGYPTNPWVLQMFKVLDHPALIKKSTGIKAEIKPTAPTTDSNPANNIKTVYKCDIMVY